MDNEKRPVFDNPDDVARIISLVMVRPEITKCNVRDFYSVAFDDPLSEWAEENQAFIDSTFEALSTSSKEEVMDFFVGEIERLLEQGLIDEEKAENLELWNHGRFSKTSTFINHAPPLIV